MALAVRKEQSKKKHGQSAVTTGRRLFAAKVDERTIWARRYRDLVRIIGADLGGLHTLSELKLILLRRLAALVVECERIEADLSQGRPADIDLLSRLTGVQRRLAETLGLDRVQREVTLHDVLAAHNDAPPPVRGRRKAEEPPTLDLSPRAARAHPRPFPARSRPCPGRRPARILRKSGGCVRGHRRHYPRALPGRAHGRPPAVRRRGRR